MSIFNPSFVLGSILLLYLVSFVVFAIIRIATGISIQRIGYFSIRRIAYTPRDGIRIDLRGLGLVLHRPTFAQPTWVSLRLTELKVTVDVMSLAGGSDAATNQPGETSAGTPGSSNHVQSSAPKSPKPILRVPDSGTSRSRTWKRLAQLKERIKRLHDKIHWLCLVDIEALNTNLVVADIGSFEIGALSVAVDTRRKTVDRGRLFQHRKVPGDDQRPVEWIFTIKSVLFTPDGSDSLDVLDICNLNIHGLLYKHLAGLRDASISLKLGRVHIPYDDLLAFKTRIDHRLGESERQSGGAVEKTSITDIIEEWNRPGSAEAKIAQTVSDSKDFVSSILRGIQEVQMAISFVGMTKAVHSIRPAGSPLHLNIAMNEFGVDMYRLDPKSPAHRMYFSSKDIAHQALLAGISIGLSLDDGSGKPQRIIYIPMVTTTVKTTLPSKTVSFSEDENVAERNANILFANLVVTSPSIDIDPKQMPLVVALTQTRPDAQQKPSTMEGHRYRLISRLLPKANIKVSVHEPVLRIALPPADAELRSTDEYDLLICTISSVSLDVESSHSSGGELHYALASNLRVSSNQLYYHTASGERHNLLITDTLELKLQVTASPEVSVIASGNLQTFSVHMVRPEISAGVRQIVQQLSKKIETDSSQHTRDLVHRNFLRPLPPWLVHFQFQGSNFGVDVAGVDPDVSKDTRGISLQLESWTAEYKIQPDAETEILTPRRRGAAKSSMTEEPSIKITPPSGLPETPSSTTDARRLAIHVRGLEGFVVEGINNVESESLISLPRFEVAFSTSSDSRGPIFHLNSHIRALYIQYSLYRYYAVGLAFTILRKAFFPNVNHTPSSGERYQHVRMGSETVEHPPTVLKELLSVDVKVELLQVKGTMPSDPPMMLQIFGAEAGRHRWAAPFMRSRLVRVYAEAPQIKSTWARIVALKALRVDLRENRKKSGRVIINERSVDVSTECIRLGVPHQLVLHQIFDNFANVLKATEQLHHRFKTGTNEYILKKQPEGPKSIPRISIRSKALLFELDDGPFEWKLGSIYRTGLLEQKQRLARHTAYIEKLKKMEELQRGSARYRTHSSQPQQRGTSNHAPNHDRQEHDTGESRPRGRSMSPSNRRARRWRYDPEGKCRLTGSAKISAEEAFLKLQRYNAQSWKKRIDGIYQIQKAGMRDIRSMFWGNDDMPDVNASPERILNMPERPGLMSALISDLHVVIDKPSFPVGDYPQFLHEIGKGMPLDTQYSLLIPLSVQIDMGEARVTLRDYPLPLLHVPAIRPGQSPRLSSWSLKTNFVIAEEWRGSESIKKVKVEVIPPEKFSNPEITGGFAIDVRRTVSPVKTYSDVEIAINTSAPTSITWGPSYQPAIQDMMMIIEGFTKPQVDPSDRTGFWDKIRFSVHSRVMVAWKGDGDVHLKLKGARDPYMVTGHGAGFVMCWRNNVRWGLHQDDDAKKFMTVTSGEYVLAIPDYSHQARESVSTDQDTESISSTSSYKNGAMFKKVIMKLSGNVRWMAGIVFERDIDQGGRSFEFIPHYEVTLRTPERASAFQRQNYDAFRGFRSNHIHLSIAIAAPLDRDWTATNAKPSLSYNTVHLSPRFFTHFFDWWSLFSGVMSLPVRQGTLFPGIEKASKKFGRHLATIKYNLLLSPLFIAHMYKHKAAEDYAEDLLSVTGLKLRIDNFMLDLHQRREEFASQRGKQVKTSGMRINQAQLDFVSADVRAVSARIAGTSSEAVKRATDEELASYQEPAHSDMSRFTIPDNDFSWIDMDDFVELDWILPAETNPETKIMPLAYAPRFTYFRQTDHGGSPSEEARKNSPFGNEPTHYCVMSQDNDPRRVQCGLIKERILKIDEHLEMHRRTLGEQELRVVRDSNRDGSLKERYHILNKQGHILEGKKEFLKSMLARLNKPPNPNQPPAKPPTESYRDLTEDDLDSDESLDDDADSMSWIEQPPLLGLAGDFNNRFIVHNVQLKWNNALRNIILRYVHQVSQRRGFVYYMSRKAVKFILDIVEEQNKSKHKPTDEPETQPESEDSEKSPKISIETDEDQDVGIESRIQQLLNDAKKFVDADDPEQAEATQKPYACEMDQDISQNFTPLNSYHVRLVAPQIQLQSEKHSKSVLLVTAKSMQLKVIQIMDKDRMTDDVSGLVQRRFSVNMDGVQFFITNQKSLMQFLHLYSGNRYGTPKGSAWPPWVPFEVNFDFKLSPFGWSRVVQKTSASLQYGKYNTLRLKFNDNINSGTPGHPHMPESMENRIDHLSVDFPTIRAICDSTQYYAMYVIVIDLLLYTEPLEKVRSERLEKIMLASDFSDLRGAPEMVTSLQGRIRQLEEIKTHFQIHAKYLDRQGWQDRLSVEQDLAGCEDELFFIMKALTTSQRKSDDRNETSHTNGLLRWYLSASEIVWHLVREKNEPLIEIQLQNAAYDRTDNSDGSNHNKMEIERVHGLNLLPNAIYPEMLAPFYENGKKLEGQDLKMLKVQWHMLEAIAGIPVLDQFEVDLFPLKVQLEREVGKQLFEYIFPGAGPNGENGNLSPFVVRQIPNPQDEDGDSDAETQPSLSDTPPYDTNRSSEEQLSATQPGSLERRLRPTKAFTEINKSRFGVGGGNGEHHFRLFHHPNHTKPSGRALSKKHSRESLLSNARPSRDTSSTSLSAMTGNSEKQRKFTLKRSTTRDAITDNEKKRPDDLTQMMARASNYMTLAHVKIPSVVLCLSYKGRGERNLEDVHNFVFRMPILEYRNKTWSNLDLALRLKRDVIKALISHTGAIIGNKFSHHRPTKQQQSRLRELANSSSLLPNSFTLTSNNASDTSSTLDRSPTIDRAESPTEKLTRTDSFASSIRNSMASSGLNISESTAIPESEAENNSDVHSHGFMRNTFTRRFTNDSQKVHKKDSTGEDPDESNRKKSVLLLGKKILGSLN